ncbi:MAG: peptidoglycan bridge formation glycyltransferase FemA/FemB family protein [Candidatus Azambacteria bacterium]|nr:peptidoglycan bridge formation glycyltransferase FemA/FemB family protein [Candidatus Azambacteria bacterium]
MEFLFNPALSREEWNEFVVRHGGGFLQSYEWIGFQEKAGNTAARIIIKKDGVTVLCANAIRHALPFKKAYWYIPYGPVISKEAQDAKEIANFFIERFARVVGKDTIFLKIEPQEMKAQELFAQRGKQSPAAQPQETVIIDCALSEEKMLSAMKPKTRYNIKVAQRHGVKIVSPDDQTKIDPEIFLSLLSTTAARHRFRTHAEQYYREMLICFLPTEVSVANHACTARLFFAQHNTEVIASALVMFFGTRATYLHGASNDTQKNIMAPYALHWEIMNLAKKAGYREYDMWGVATERSSDETKRKWSGFSRFKLGFGGVVVERPGAFDFPLRPLWYIIYKGGKQVSHIRSWLNVV